MSGVARLRHSLLPWLIAGVIAWAGVAWIGWTLWNQDPPRAGFDLALLLDGARAVAAGQSPYDPAMLAGGSPSATELFYSYPPPVAQAMQLVAWLPDGVVLVLWAIGATLGLGHIAGEIARRDRQGEPRSTVIGVKAILAAPLFLPFAVALLFGNLDAWYPLLYGALVLAAFPTSGRWTWLAAGAAVAVVAIAKLHPAVLGLWLLVRLFADRDGPWRTVLVAAVVTGARDPRGEPPARRRAAVAGLRRRDPCRRGRGARGPAEPRAGVTARAGDGAGRPGAAGRAGRRDADGGGRHGARGVARPRPDREPGDRVHCLARRAAGDLVPLPGRARPDRAGAGDHAARDAGRGSRPRSPWRVSRSGCRRWCGSAIALVIVAALQVRPGRPPQQVPRPVPPWSRLQHAPPAPRLPAMPARP